MFGHEWKQLHFPFFRRFFSLKFYTENRCANENVEIYKGGESSVGLTSMALFSSCEW